jgi:hypothetical protein
MPKGRQRFSTGDGPPGNPPDGPTQRAIDDSGQWLPIINLSTSMHEKHTSTHICTIDMNDSLNLSAKIAGLHSHRSAFPIGTHERPNIVPTIYESRTRLAANQIYQMRDLRHGCQGSITITNPIMEE